MSSKVESPPLATKADRRVGNRRSDIVDAAMTLFAERGVEHVSTRQIAQRVGISQPSLYAHFPTKEALLEEVCTRAFEELSARMQSVVCGKPSLDQMRQLGRVYIGFGLERPDAYRIAFMREHGPQSPEAKGPVLAAGMQAFGICRDNVVGLLEGKASAEDSEIAAQIQWSCMHGLVSLLLSMPEFPWAERDRLIESHLEFIVSALALRLR
jgi:AcrR family transcriptional regulator